jgi:hypothetical protein
MRSILAAIAFSCLLVPAALANPEVDSAVKTFEKVGGDAAKLKIFCEMEKFESSADPAAGQEELDAIDEQMTDYVEQLGAEFKAALQAAGQPDSADAKTYGLAFGALIAKCPE